MHEKTPPLEKTVQLARLMKILAEPNRIMIIDLLLKGTQCNCKIGEALQMSPNLISHHLGVLRDAGLVNMERDPYDARWIYYSINREKISALKKSLEDFLTIDQTDEMGKSCHPEINPQFVDHLSISRG